MTSWRFWDWERSDSDESTISSVVETRLPAAVRMRDFCSSVNVGDVPMFQCSWALVEVLLTFWPPGPEERTKTMAISDSGTSVFGTCDIIDGGIRLNCRDIRRTRQ